MEKGQFLRTSCSLSSVRPTDSTNAGRSRRDGVKKLKIFRLSFGGEDVKFRTRKRKKLAVDCPPHSFIEGCTVVSGIERCFFSDKVAVPVALGHYEDKIDLIQQISDAEKINDGVAIALYGLNAARQQFQVPSSPSFLPALSLSDSKPHSASWTRKRHSNCNHDHEWKK